MSYSNRISKDVAADSRFSKHYKTNFIRLFCWSYSSLSLIYWFYKKTLLILLFLELWNYKFIKRISPHFYELDFWIELYQMWLLISYFASLTNRVSWDQTVDFAFLLALQTKFYQMWLLIWHVCENYESNFIWQVCWHFLFQDFENLNLSDVPT